MESWMPILLPLALVLGRVSGFLAAAPLFSSPTIPFYVRAGFVLTMTIFLAGVTPQATAADVHWMTGVVWITTEVVLGAGLGLAARLVYLCVQQGGRIAGRQMGMLMAKVFDPISGEQSQPVGILFDMCFLLLFLAAGGHHLLLTVLGRSFDILSPGGAFDFSQLVTGIIEAGSAMLLLAMKLAAPIIASFLILGVVLAVLARVLPEMNLLMASLPLRVGLGLTMAAAILPMMESFTADVVSWMKQYLLA